MRKGTEMKKFFAAVAVVMLVMLVTLVAPHYAFAERNEKTADVTDLIDARQVDVYVEGTVMGELVLGSRGVLTLIYVDQKLSQSIASDGSLEHWVRTMGQYFGTDATRGKAVFIAHLDAFKPWDFDPTKIFVGGYHVQKDDVLSPSATNPFGQLASKSEGVFAFAVPASEVKVGKEIQLGYGDDAITWKVPK